MALTTRHATRIGLSVLLVLVQVGCATAPYLLPEPPSEQTRAQFGTIGVVSAHFTPKAEFVAPAKGGGAGAGRGAATGAGKGAAFVAELSRGCHGQGCAIVLLVVPAAIIGGLIGGVAGAATAVPAEAVEEAEAAIKTVLATLKVQEALRDRVLQVARDQTRHHFVLFEDQGPPAPDATVSYGSLASGGIDAILEISVLVVDLAGEWDVNPPLALVMTMQARLLRAVDGLELYAHTLEYRSATRKFTEWAMNNAKPFRDELNLAQQSLAEKIVEELFLLYLPQAERDGRHNGPTPSDGVAQRSKR